MVPRLLLWTGVSSIRQIPIGFDQPGIAARIAYHGVGEFIEVEQLTRERLSELIQKVLKNRGYRDKARYFQKVIVETRGLDLAADVIEQAFSKNRSADKTDRHASLPGA
jgi:zeaxanthin glucosyltransferase